MQAVQQDLWTWEPKLAQAGLLMGHDFEFEHAEVMIAALSSCLTDSSYILVLMPDGVFVCGISYGGEHAPGVTASGA